MPNPSVPNAPEGELARPDPPAEQNALATAARLPHFTADHGALPSRAVTQADLQRFSKATADLADEQLMREAWSRPSPPEHC
jgi:hypothetical protein